MSIGIATFNILADGLCENEFFCEGGDYTSISWDVRRDKLIDVIKSLLQDVDIIVTQENDHFLDIFGGLNLVSDIYGGIFGANLSKACKATTLKARSQLRRWCASTLSTVSDEHTYQRCNDLFLNRNGKHLDNAKSFLDECGDYAQLFSSFYTCCPTDLYKSHDGIGIYYRKDKVALENASIPGAHPCNQVRQKDVAFITNAEGFVRCTFRLLLEKTSSGSNTQFTVYGGHLKSGEDVKMEHARCRELFTVLEDAHQHTCPIIAMDSNNSTLYEQNYPDVELSVTSSTNESVEVTIPGKLSALIDRYGFVDAVGADFQTGNECFKMRHGLGGQPSKHFQLMFDTIDKILVPRSLHIVPQAYNLTEFGFHRYDPARRGEILELRCNPDKRTELEAQCRTNSRIYSTACSVEAFGPEHVLSGLYPNTSAPSDHPPVSCTILLLSPPP